MTFPGLKKLAKEFGFINNGRFLFGFLKNSYIMFADGANQKNVWFRFPNKLDADDKQKIESWKKKGYAKKVDFLEENSFDVELVFTEYFIPFKIAKIKEVIEDITDYIANKYPEAKIACSGDDCLVSDGLDIYDVDGVPLPMCSSCVQRLENTIENTYEEEKLQPGNYLQGIMLAAFFSIPGIFLTFFFFILGRIAGISGIVYYYLAQKGYMQAKGKLNKIGVFIISGISIIYTAVGTYLSYVGYVIRELTKEPSLKGAPFADLVKIGFEIVTDPVVKNELLKNIYLSLFLCGICIILSTIHALKRTGKLKIKKI